MLTQEQMNKIADGFQRCRGNRPIWQEESETIDRWIQDTVTSYGLLEAVLSGLLLIDVSDGDVVFKSSADGDERVRELLKQSPEARSMLDRLESNKELRDHLTAEKEKPWPSAKSLPGRILVLLKFVMESESPNDEQIAGILNCETSTVQLATQALEKRGFVGKNPSDDQT